jgi:hypothetical protein
MICCVFTGDIVHSSRLSATEVDAAMARLSASLQGRSPVDIRFTRFRGDGWQAMLPAPWEALDTAISLTAAARAEGFATRIAIGIDAIEYAGLHDLSDARGAAFVHSGHALDQMQKGQRLAIAGSLTIDEDRAIMAILDERIGRWSRLQAEAIAQTTDPTATTDRETARRLGISPQALSERLYSSGYPSMCYAAELWKTAKIAAKWPDLTNG